MLDCLKKTLFSSRSVFFMPLSSNGKITDLYSVDAGSIPVGGFVVGGGIGRR